MPDTRASVSGAGKDMSSRSIFWGAAFLVTLIIPFTVSLYAILFFYELWKNGWDRSRKILMTLLLLTAIPFFMVIMDEIIRVVASQSALSEFVFQNDINVSGK